MRVEVFGRGLVGGGGVVVDVVRKEAGRIVEIQLFDVGR